MPFDTGPKDVAPNMAATPANVQGVGRLDKPLGRGLEDVSYLFLSQGTADALPREQTSIRPPARASSEPALHQRSVLLRRRQHFAKDQLAAALTQFDGALEEGLRGIDVNVPCDPCGEIDVIALDRVNQLTLIDFDTTPNDGLLLRGLGHFDWAMRSIAILRRMYRGQIINFSLQPRLFLVAPAFSPLLKQAAHQITRPQIGWMRYHVVDVGGGTGIFFEDVEG